MPGPQLGTRLLKFIWFSEFVWRLSSFDSHFRLEIVPLTISPVCSVLAQPPLCLLWLMWPCPQLCTPPSDHATGYDIVIYFRFFISATLSVRTWAWDRVM